MGFREVGGAKSYRNWALWSVDEYIVGKFTGTSTDNYGKVNYHIEVQETNQEFDKEHHYIATRGKNAGKPVYDKEIVVGETLALNHSGSLEYKMNQVNEGEVIKLVYTGKTRLPENHQFAGSECHQMDVYIAEDSEGEAISVDNNTDIDSFTQL